jgi:hypothetical protein
VRSADIEFMQDIGRVLGQDTDYPLDGTLLYAVVDENYVAASIFKDFNGVTYYRRPDLDGLTDTLLDLWESYPVGKRWETIEYVIRDGRFEATFTYPENVVPDEEPFQRRDAIVAKYFGKQPIRYLPSREHPEGYLFEY